MVMKRWNQPGLLMGRAGKKKGGDEKTKF